MKLIGYYLSLSPSQQIALLNQCLTIGSSSFAFAVKAFRGFLFTVVS